MKLYFKTVVFILLLIGSAFWINIHFSGVAVSEAMSAQIADSAAAAAGDLAPAFQKAFLSGKELDGIKALHAFSQKTGSVFAGLAATDGTVLAHTNVALTGTRLADPLMLKGLRTGAPHFRRLFHNGEEIVETVIPLPRQKGSSGEELLFQGPDAPGENAGFLRAGLPLTPARKAEKDITFKLLILAVLIAAAATALSTFFASVILRQVYLLKEGIRKVREGNYDFSVPVISRDELGEVAVSFNKLSRGLSETTVSKEYLDSVLESMPDPLLITDEAGNILKGNRAAAEFSGYDFLPPGSRNLRELLEPQTEGAAEPFALLSWGGHIKELDLWFKARDGKRLPVMLSAAFIGGAGGRQVVSVLKDTAQHKESEARMAQYLKEVETVNSELDAFAHTVSHDLKEPLRGIEMFSAMLLSDFGAKLDPQAGDYLSRVVKASGRMRRLIDDLLSYARVARVRNPYEYASTARLAEEAVAGLSVLIEERKAVVKVSGDLPEIFCDPVKIRQFFQNLVSNAVKYNDKPAPEIEISAERFGEYYWKFLVRDNGIGVPSQYFEEIFRMFKRLHSRQEYGGGTGAGLAIAKKIVEEHSGRIWVESEEGKGSVFYALIPADLSKKP
ncbi:MAG: PAS domain S-box protein [Elusimicrobia bacterium]|nr:PAS domain S-box protein [Elusimicrobiota bacterium]